MHQTVGANDVSAIGLTDGLHAKTDTKNRHISRRHLDDVQANAGFIWRTGTGRENDAFRVQRQCVFSAEFIVAHDVQLDAQLSDQMHQIVGKAVVIIDYQEHLRLPKAADCRAGQRIIDRVMCLRRIAQLPQLRETGPWLC